MFALLGLGLFRYLLATTKYDFLGSSFFINFLHWLLQAPFFQACVNGDQFMTTQINKNHIFSPQGRETWFQEGGRGTCCEAGTGCTTGAWAEVDVRSATLDDESDPPSELCMLGLQEGGGGEREREGT